MNDVSRLRRPYDRFNRDISAIFNKTNFTKSVLQTIRFPADCFQSNDFDIHSVTEIMIRTVGDGKTIAFDDLHIVIPTFPI